MDRKGPLNLEKLEKIIGKFPNRPRPFYQEKLGWSKSKIYDYFNTLRNQKKAYSDNGCWNLKTTTEAGPFVSANNKKAKPFGFLGSLKWKDEHEAEKTDRSLRRIEARMAARREIIELDDNDPNYAKKVNQIEYKWRKKYGLVS